MQTPYYSLLFNALCAQAEYDVIFTANATAALKIVASMVCIERKHFKNRNAADIPFLCVFCMQFHIIRGVLCMQATP